MKDNDPVVTQTVSAEEARVLEHVPVAHHVYVFTCGDHECGPHIVLFDADNVPLMQAVLKPEYVEEFCEILQSVAPFKRKQLS
jgi:hypothetical protein